MSKYRYGEPSYVHSTIGAAMILAVVVAGAVGYVAETVVTAVAGWLR